MVLPVQHTTERKFKNLIDQYVMFKPIKIFPVTAFLKHISIHIHNSNETRDLSMISSLKPSIFYDTFTLY